MTARGSTPRRSSPTGLSADLSTDRLNAAADLR